MITREWKVFFATLKKEKLYQIPTYRMKKEEVKTIDDKLNTMEFKVFGGH